MKVDFWIDPICPFCWATSRWIIRVAPERGLEINWQPISLFFKNEMTDPENPYYEAAARGRKLLRVMEAARAGGHQDKLGDLFTEFGRHIHHRDELEFDVAATLGKVGLDPALEAALDEETWDENIRTGQKAGLDLVGDDVGTPIIAVDGKQGRVGLFGPVITEIPDVEGSVDLWDGFMKMVDAPGFFELKKTRTDMPSLLDESELDKQLR